MSDEKCEFFYMISMYVLLLVFMNIGENSGLYEIMMLEPGTFKEGAELNF